MGKCSFQDIWLQNLNYNKWIRKDISDCHAAKCILCVKKIDVSNMGESALRSHMTSKKHKTLMEDQAKSVSVTTLFQAKESVATNKEQSTLPLKIGKNETLKAEIRWALKVIKSHYSYRSCIGIEKLFKLMFEDSEIAANFSCGERKCSYICCFGLAPHFKDLLINEIKVKNEGYVLMFDESHNKFTQSKQLDLHVRLWQNNAVITRYLTSKFLGHATAENIIENIQECVGSLPLGNIFQLSMDGPNVNWKVFTLLQELLCAEKDIKLVNIGSCGLHIVHNAFRHAATSCVFNVQSLLTSMYRLFKDSPARREDLSDLAKDTKMPLKFCPHRWLENSPVCERAIQIWPTIVKFENAVKVKSLKHPNNISFDVVRKWVNDPLALAKLHFFNSVVTELIPFLQNFQTDKPMLPFMSTELEKMLRGLMSRFVKPKLIDEASTSLKIVNLDVLDKENCCTYQKIDIGFQAEKELTRCSKLSNVSERLLMEFRIACKTFLQELVVKLLFKNPLKYSLVRNMKCFDPKLMANEKSETCTQNFKKVVATLVEANRLKPDMVDRLIREYKQFISTIAKVNSSFINFDASLKLSRVDVLLHEHMGSNSTFNNLWQVTKSLLLLSHGQASVERGFSINKELIVENLKEASIVAQRIIYDYISYVGGVEHVEMTKCLLQSANAARQRYMSHLDERNKVKVRTALQCKRKMLFDEVDVLKKKKKCMEGEITALLKSADELAIKAENSRNFMCITQSNSFRKTAKEKQDQLRDFEKELSKKLDVANNTK